MEIQICVGWNERLIAKRLLQQVNSSSITCTNKFTAQSILLVHPSPCFRGSEAVKHRMHTDPFYRTYCHLLPCFRSSTRKYNVVRLGCQQKWGHIITLKKPSYVLHTSNWLSHTLFNVSPWTQPFTSLYSLCCLPTTSGGGTTQRCHHQDRGRFPWSETC